MNKGIVIFGLNGAGKSTLAHALARRLGFREMDVEDYYFPQQRESRMRSMEGMGDESHSGIPFAVSRTQEEVQQALIGDMNAAHGFVLACVNLKWDDEIIRRIDLAVRLTAPLDERLARIETRETRRFGDRVLPGGDMYASQAEFRRMVAGRDESTLDANEKRLICPVLRLDGRAPVDENVDRIIEYMENRSV
ncbi:MAG: AAA family ATPase [Clostridia bacterium]|nr:AAA family ATPase [Clostridia bacterium]